MEDVIEKYGDYKGPGWSFNGLPKQYLESSDEFKKEKVLNPCVLKWCPQMGFSNITWVVVIISCCSGPSPLFSCSEP